MNPTKQSHTKTPWKYTSSSKYGRPQISGANGHQVCLMWRDGEMEANALHIVKCVNCHDAIAEALKIAKSILDDEGIIIDDISNYGNYKASLMKISDAILLAEIE